MKWVVGSFAVLVALVIGVAGGWAMRGRADEALWRNYVSTPSATTPPPPPSTPTVPVTAPTMTAKAPSAWVEDADAFKWPSSATDDVVMVDATHYLLKRSWVVRVTSSNDVMTARMIPAYVDGVVVGVRIFGVRAGTAVAKGGLQNGDTLETLNGVSLADTAEAARAYDRVPTAKNLVLGLERRGAHVDIHYRVIDS